MRVFLDFEASSLGKHGYPIEVAWVFEDGHAEAHLIRPAPGWTDWDAVSQAIHGIPRATLFEEGEPHDLVAQRMVAALNSHDLLASAPSWDGKWLSVLLRAAGLPRHALRLRGADAALRECIAAMLAPGAAPDQREKTVADLLAMAGGRADGPPAHRALPDAQAERAVWLRARAAAEALLRGPQQPDGS